MNDVFDWLNTPAKTLDTAAGDQARVRQEQLTKPPGSLGALETLVIHLAQLQGRALPRIGRIHIAVFAADHGVAIENVSAFPQAVTAQMINNFASGGAAISVLAGGLGAQLEIVDLGTVGESVASPCVTRQHIAPSTANLAHEAAMTLSQLAAALRAGADSTRRAVEAGADLFIGGDMGIGNTTAATALACALLDAAPQALAGPGTGLGVAGVAHKVKVIERALVLHAAHLADPLEALRRLGGFEIAALVGAYIASAQKGMPILVDGFITSAAALAACRIHPRTCDWLLFAHRSAEPGHAAILAALNAKPLLDLGMRLGEGSGAAVAVPLLRAACALHAGMATFAGAGVSTGH